MSSFSYQFIDSFYIDIFVFYSNNIMRNNVKKNLADVTNIIRQSCVKEKSAIALLLAGASVHLQGKIKIVTS